MVMKVVYAFQWIGKKALTGKIKESPWHDNKNVLKQQFHYSDVVSYGLV